MKESEFLLFGAKNMDPVLAFKNSIKVTEGSGKTRFALKIFHCLTFTLNNPATINTIGITWSLDRTKFYSNSQILGSFLGIKANTINTNFRTHGFIIDKTNSEEIRSEYPTLYDPRNWKGRTHSSISFTPDADLSIIERIPSTYGGNAEFTPDLIAQSKLPILNLQVIPSPQSMIPIKPIKQPEAGIVKDDPLQHALLEVITKKSRFSQIDMNIIIEKTTKLWRCSIPNGSSATRDQIKEILFRMTKSTQTDYEVSAALFLMTDADESQTDDKITFIQFLKFVLSYGFNGVDKVAELVAQPSIASQLSQWSQNSQIEVPAFQPWFQPTFNNRTANQFLSMQPTGNWLLRPSNELPGTFVVHRKLGELHPRVFATRVFNDPLSDKSLSVEFSNGKVRNADSWNSLLFDVLSLSGAPPFAQKNRFRRAEFGGAENIVGERDEGSIRMDEAFGIPFDSPLFADL